MCYIYITREIFFMMLKEDRLQQIGVNFNEWRIPRNITDSEIKMAKQLCHACKLQYNVDHFIAI